MAEDKYINQLPDGGLLLPTDVFPITRDDVDYHVNLDAGPVSPVLTTDLVLTLRGTTFHLVPVSAVLAASGPPGQQGQLNFSIAGNSGLSAGVM